MKKEGEEEDAAPFVLIDSIRQSAIESTKKVEPDGIAGKSRLRL